MRQYYISKRAPESWVVLGMSSNSYVGYIEKVMKKWRWIRAKLVVVCVWEPKELRPKLVTFDVWCVDNNDVVVKTH